jgi:biotin transport system substrate-specific component
MVFCALFAALTAAGVFIKIPIPGTLMSFTLQTFFIFLAGLLLEPKFALISQAVYAAIGLIGLPVFMNGGGISYVLQPSFGFIIGFCVAAMLISMLVRRSILVLISKKSNESKTPEIIKIIGFSLLCVVVMYVIGVTYMSLMLNVYLGKGVPLDTIIITYNGIFILLDILKFAAAIPLGIAILKRMPMSLSAK